MEAANLQVLWDHLQIEKQLATYCRGIDRCDKELLKTVYWPEAYEEHGLFNGNAWEFAEFIIPLLKTMKITMHSISNTLIEVQGDTAQSETYVSAYHLMEDASGAAVDMVVAGRYLDRFERRGSEWRIIRRTFVMDWNQNQKATVQWGGGMYESLKIRGSNDQDDPSHAFFTSKSEK